MRSARVLRSVARAFGLSLGLGLAALGCASSSKGPTEVSVLPDANIASYATFGWLPAAAPAGASEAPVSILDSNLKDAIRAQLALRGYRESDSHPDLRIGFETVTAAVEEVKESPFRVGLGVGGFGGPVGVGVGTSAPVGKSTVTTNQETRLTIRAVDTQRNKEVWAATTGGLDPRSLDASGVEKAVANTLAAFPSRPR